MNAVREAESAWVRLAGLYHAVLPAARSAVAPVLTLPQFDVLVQLARCEREGVECTPGGLSRMLLVTAPAAPESVPGRFEKIDQGQNFTVGAARGAGAPHA